VAAYYSGRVHSVVYEDSEQAFYILKMILDKENPDPDNWEALEALKLSNVTVRGYVPGMQIRTGSWFGFEANWVTHQTYGKQLVVTKAPFVQGGWTADNALKALSANDVGYFTIRQIRESFEDSEVEDSELVSALGDLEQLKAIGLDPVVAEHVVATWQSVVTYFRALGFLSDLGLPSGKVRQVWATFGDDSERILSTDPWALVQIDGITFHQADEIAVRLGLSLDTPARVKGALSFVTKNQRQMGHLFLTMPQLYGELSLLLSDITLNTFAIAVADCHKNKQVVVDRITRPDLKAVYDPWSYVLENDSAELLQERVVEAKPDESYRKSLESVGPLTGESVAKGASLIEVAKVAVEEWGLSSKLALSDDQKQGVVNAICAPVSILTGKPGTGKSTSLRAAVRIFQEAGIRFLLCAPTGIAAKNLSALTGAPAQTIHRAFSAQGKSEESDRESTYVGIVNSGGKNNQETEQGSIWEYGPDNTHPADVVVVDESSMLDQHLIYRLLSCTHAKCRVVFVGDPNQLPSVGPGNVLRELLKSGMFATVSLDTIFRQKDTSSIVYAAHSILRGEIPEDLTGDFALIKAGNEEEASDIIVQLAQKLYDRRANFQVLSPRHAGPSGVTALNARLRELLNPQVDGAKELKLGEDTIREGDRIMVVKNNYELGVYNGDVGKVFRIDRKLKIVDLKIFGEPPLLVTMAFKDIQTHIRLAYACTIHKSQGLEYDVIVMPLLDSFRFQLQRNLLYTGTTRAKKRVLLVGSYSALATAVYNDREDLRNSLFCDRLLKSGL
jgi:exodeoxyribonuclease V alpha subunit